jgi:uncharacterized protein (TIGR03435 family)
MVRQFTLLVALVCSGGAAVAQTAAPAAPPEFVVATIKPVDPGPKAGRFFKMESENRFHAINFSLKLLIAAAYDLNPRTISGGPSWVESDKFDIQAVTPGDKAPDHDAQMLMLRGLLADRFKLVFHRTPKVFSIYEITVAKDGPTMAESLTPDAQPNVVSMVFPTKMVMPARNATVSDLARVMQRAILDRPVVDKTGLTDRYNFNLEWAVDETQFEGAIPPQEGSDAPPLLLAMQQQLGLQMKATKGPVDTLVIDSVQKPGAN